MNTKMDRNGVLVLLACMALTLVLGSVHAFSVFLEPLENDFGALRSDVSLIYSSALVCLTVCVLFGHRVYSYLSPALFVTIVCLLAAVGCVIAGQATDLSMILLGYGVMFGAANGLGYGFALQCVAQANPGQKGLVIGLITAAYALGAAVAPIPFEMLLNDGGFTAAMNGFAIVMLASAPVIAGLLMKGKAFVKAEAVTENHNTSPGHHRLVAKLWLGYGTAVAAGLMVIGHATGIARAGGLSSQLVLLAPIVIAISNMFGSVMGGWMADRVTVRRTVMAFPVISAASLFILAYFDGVQVVLGGLALVGFTYGATIGAYPAVVASLFGVVGSARIYGRVFTAWGTAGLFAPWFAGVLFESTGDYKVALMVAGSLGFVSLVTVWFLPTDGNGVDAS